MLKRIRIWYEGTPVQYDEDPRGPIVLGAPPFERHWTASAAHSVVQFHKKEWKWVIPVYLAILAIVISL